MDAYVYGGSELRLRELLASAVDEPVAEAGEVVTKLLTDRPTTAIITDRRTVYGSIGKLAAVTEGQTLDAGDFFFDSVKLTDLRSGQPNCSPVSLSQDASWARSKTQRFLAEPYQSL